MASLAAAKEKAAKRNSAAAAAAVCGKRLKLETSKTKFAQNLDAHLAWFYILRDMIRF